jgi:heterodisulfide reductase subunit A-like polyferredoxin
MNTMEVLNAIRREKLVDFVSLHPQLCADDGDQYLQILLDNKDIDKLYVAACDPLMQQKMFRDAFEAVGFDKSKHIALDIRNMSTEEAVSAIKKIISDKT